MNGNPNDKCTIFLFDVFVVFFVSTSPSCTYCMVFVVVVPRPDWWSLRPWSAMDVSDTGPCDLVGCSEDVLSPPIDRHIARSL